MGVIRKMVSAHGQKKTTNKMNLKRENESIKKFLERKINMIQIFGRKTFLIKGIIL